MKRANLLLALGVAGALAAATTAGAQQITYDFEDLATNTAVTTQYDGVTFSVLPQSCGNSPTLYMRTRTTDGGTSSGVKCLGIDTGCPDFSPDYLRMVFDNPQSHVSFTLGNAAGTYVVRAYSTVSGAGLLSTQNIVIGGAGTVGVHRVVNVNAGAGNLRRIEIQEAVGLWEYIDDLTFDLDVTPPIAVISSPTAASCGCGVVQVRGSAYDPELTYERDTLEYRAAGGDDWTLVDSATTPVEDGILYNWNTTGLSEGFYFLKLTVYDITGLFSTDTTVVWVSADFDVVSFTLPTILGGVACPDGTVWDQYCTGGYTVDYSAMAPISYQPVDPLHPTYDGYRTNEQLASWDTSGLADGSYLIRVRGTNDCDDSLSLTRSVIVDNTRPVAVITSPASCGYVDGVVQVRGTASDAHIAGWSLTYTGGAVHGWAPIAAGVGNIVNGVLGAWDTSGLAPCEYTLRLVVTDRSVINCSDSRNQSEYTVSVSVGCNADFNRDGTLNSQDFFDFLTAFFSGCP